MLDGLARRMRERIRSSSSSLGDGSRMVMGFADDLVSRVAEQPLGACVPTLNDAFEVLADNRVVRGIPRSQRGAAACALPRRVPDAASAAVSASMLVAVKSPLGGCASNVRRDAKVPPDVSGPTPLYFTHSSLSNLRGRGLSQWPGQEPQRLLLRSEQSGLAGSLVLPDTRLELRRAHAAASQSDRRCLPSERP